MGTATAIDVDVIAVLAQRIAALSRAGVEPLAAWQALSRRSDDLAPIAASVATGLGLGGSVGESLLAARADRAARSMAAACQLSVSVGMPLAGVLDALAEALFEEQEQQRQREVAMAGPRAGITVLTWLPAAGLGLGLATGVNTLAVLITTSPGRASLAVGIALWLAGHRWLRHLLRRAERVGT